jgi:hypothetical protein
MITPLHIAICAVSNPTWQLFYGNSELSCTTTEAACSVWGGAPEAAAVGFHAAVAAGVTVVLAVFQGD